MFEPMVDLDSGRVIGFATAVRTPWRRGADPADLVDAEIEDAVGRVRAAGPVTVPMHVEVRADTVALAGHRLRALWPAMLHGQGRGPGTTLVLDTARRTVGPSRLLAGAQRARRDGHRLAAPVGGLAPDELDALRPDFLVLDHGVTRALGGPDDAWSLAVLAAAGGIASALGATLVARGISDDATLALVRRHGVTVASGPVLAADQTDADAAALRPAPGLAARRHATAPRAAGRPAVDVTPPASRPLADLARPAVTLGADARGDDVRAALAEAPDSAGVVLVDDGRPVGYLDRDRFLLAIAGPYGRAVYAGRPAARLADAPRTRPAHADAAATLSRALAGDPHRRYDDVVVVGEDERVVGVVRFADLVARGHAAPGHAAPEHGAVPDGTAAAREHAVRGPSVTTRRAIVSVRPSARAAPRTSGRSADPDAGWWFSATRP